MSKAPFLVAFLLPFIGCSQNRPSETVGVVSTESQGCGPELSEAQILHIVKDAIAGPGNDPPSSDTDYHLSIGTRGCDYVVIGIKQPETTPAEFVITLDRTGKIKSWPWCCVSDAEVPTAVTDEDVLPPFVGYGGQGKAEPGASDKPTGEKNAEEVPTREQGRCDGALTALGKTTGAPDYQGIRFRCGALWPERVCLSVLRAECTLTVVMGASIPAEADEHLVLECDENAIRVRTPADLAGSVLIESGEEALEYLRFFSSLWTVHLFEQPSLEIFAARKKKGACIKTCLPVKIWNRLGFEKPDVSETSDGFVVSRFVIRRAHSELGISVFRVVEKVGHDGAVTVLTEKALKLSREDFSGLGFADYL